MIAATEPESWVEVISPWPASLSSSTRLMVVQSVPPRACISWNCNEVGDHQISGDVVSMVKILDVLPLGVSVGGGLRHPSLLSTPVTLTLALSAGGPLHNPYGRILSVSVVPRSPFVLRTFPPRAGETLVFCKGLAERERGNVLPPCTVLRWPRPAGTLYNLCRKRL